MTSEQCIVIVKQAIGKQNTQSVMETCRKSQQLKTFFMSKTWAVYCGTSTSSICHPSSFILHLTSLRSKSLARTHGDSCIFKWEVIVWKCLVSNVCLSVRGTFFCFVWQVAGTLVLSIFGASQVTRNTCLHAWDTFHQKTFSYKNIQTLKYSFDLETLFFINIFSYIKKKHIQTLKYPCDVMETLQL